MEYLNTLKDFFGMLGFVFSSFPKEFQIGIIAIILLAIFMTFGLSSACDKEKKAEKKRIKSEKKQVKEDKKKEKNKKESNVLSNENEDDSEINDFEITVKNEIFEDEMKDLSFSAIRNENAEIEVYTFKAEKERNESNLNDESDIESIVVNVKDIEPKYFDNIHLANCHSVDHLFINETGVYLLFNMSLGSKIISGEEDDEFLFFEGNKELNPFSRKSGYIKKAKKYLDVNVENIFIIIIDKDIDVVQSSLSIFKNKEDFERSLILKPCIFNKNEMNLLLGSPLLK